MPRLWRTTFEGHELRKADQETWLNYMLSVKLTIPPDGENARRAEASTVHGDWQAEALRREARTFR